MELIVCCTEYAYYRHMLSTCFITGEINLDLGETCVCWDSPLKRNYFSFKLKKIACEEILDMYYIKEEILCQYLVSYTFSLH